MRFKSKCDHDFYVNYVNRMNKNKVIINHPIYNLPKNLNKYPPLNKWALRPNP